MLRLPTRSQGNASAKAGRYTPRNDNSYTNTNKQKAGHHVPAFLLRFYFLKSPAPICFIVMKIVEFYHGRGSRKNTHRKAR